MKEYEQKLYSNPTYKSSLPNSDKKEINRDKYQKLLYRAENIYNKFINKA